MPLYEYRCAARHTLEHYYPTEQQAPPMKPCSQCTGMAVRLFPLVNCLQYFSESSGRIIENLDKGRVLHSYGEHERLMRQKGVEPATQWFSSDMKRSDGLKSGNIYPVKGSV